MLFLSFLVILIGACIGSFASAVSYRIPRDEGFLKGRSHCDNCNSLIHWYDNIPVLSYIALKGRCRNCGKKISIRYPIIELTTGVLFLLISWLKAAPVFEPFLLLYYYSLATILVIIFIIDLESQIIPDRLVFLLILFTFAGILASSDDKFYVLLLTGFSASLFLLMINIITSGKGMGLGDVKLAIFGGLFLGFPDTVTWLFLSFVTGAFVGLILIFLKKAQFGKQIAFGPFLIFSLFIVFFWGEPLSRFLIPYL